MPYKSIEDKRAADKRRYERIKSDPALVAEHRERRRKYMSAYRDARPEAREYDRCVSRRSYVRIYAENPQPYFDRARARRALLAQAPGRHTEQEFQRLCRVHENRCFYCGEERMFLTRDHVIPLSRGGSDSILNIVPACGGCNASKNDSTLLEFELRCTKRRRK